MVKKTQSLAKSRPDWAGRISSARKAAKLSQAALAEKLGSSQSAIADYETGRSQPSFEIMRKIAGALGVLPAWLTYGAGREKPDNVSEKEKILVVRFLKQMDDDPFFTFIMFEVEKMLIDLEFYHHDIELQLLLSARIQNAILQTRPFDGANHVPGPVVIERVAEQIAIEAAAIRQGLTLLRLSRIANIPVLQPNFAVDL